MAKPLNYPKTNRPILHMLIGVPGSGKTTVRRKIMSRYPDRKFEILSSDDIVEKYCHEEGVTYSEGFQTFIKPATKKLNENQRFFIKEKNNIIWDQTNLFVKSRRKKLLQFPKEYYKIATVVQTSDDNIWKRQNERHKVGRSIPNKILLDMLENWQMPDTINEDFDLIEVYDNGNLEL